MSFFSALLLLLIAAYLFGHLSLMWLLVWGSVCVVLELIEGSA